MLVKVRHGAVRWVEPYEDRTTVKTGFRGMTVDMPQKEAERLIAEDAVVLPDDELTRGGRMMPLPSTASDEELKAWVSVANEGDIEQACLDNPKIADRIRNARELYESELRAQNELQGGVPAEAGKHVGDDGIEDLGGNVDDSELGDPEPDENFDPDADPTAEGSEEEPTPEEIDEEIDDPEPNQFDLEDVVRQSVAKVSEFLSEHPEYAEQVLAAEEARANSGDSEPQNVRVGVVNAVNVAASHVSA